MMDKNIQTASSRKDLYRHVSVLALMAALAVTTLPRDAHAQAAITTALATSATTKAAQDAAAKAAQDAAAKAAAAAAAKAAQDAAAKSAAAAA
ncbi:MAG: hypothetical protein ACK5BX_10585, partial [Bradyrhizobium sp.]